MRAICPPRTLFNFGGQNLPLEIEQPAIVLTLTGDHQRATGTLAGVLRTEVVVASLRQLAGSFDASLCGGATVESITTQITQSSDILADGTQDSARDCDGISIGLGFDASAVMLGAIGDATPVAPDPCAMR